MINPTGPARRLVVGDLLQRSGVEGGGQPSRRERDLDSSLSISPTKSRIEPGSVSASRLASRISTAPDIRPDRRLPGLSDRADKVDARSR
jgi:hypothetical protein